MSLNSADQIAEMKFGDDCKVGMSYTMVTTEQDIVINEYAKPDVQKSVAGRKYLRDEIEQSQEQLTPKFSHANCLSFDQSYYLRTIGQIEIQKKLEEKYGNLATKYSLIALSGFGAVQGFWASVGRSAKDLQKVFLVDFKKAIKKGAVKKGADVTTGILFGSKHDRLPVNPLMKQLRKMFRDSGRDLLVRDCKTDIFLPIQDISKRTIVINKENSPLMPIYVATGAALFDPLFFKSKKYFDGMGILNGDVVKNNDFLLRKNNPTLSIDSVGSPVRFFDTGIDQIDRADLAVKISDQKHETDLIMSSMTRGNYNRYECEPIDEYYQFSVKDNAIEAALRSADKVEV